MRILSILVAPILIIHLALGMVFPSAQLDSLPLVIVVRDGAGSPLQGVPIQILVTGPPHTPYDSCVTDDQGTCRLIIPPGAYLIRFERGWRGLEFVPPEEQNAGAMNDAGAAGGGFGIYFEPSDTVQYVTFVVGQCDGLLVPLWDMSRDPAAPPQPFAVPDDPFGDPADALAGVDLGPLVGAIDREETVTPGPESTSDIQIVEDELPIGILTQTAEDGPPSTPQTTDEEVTLNAHNVLLGILGLVIGGAALLAGAVLLRRLRHREG